jgi:hypothetical protein
MPVCTYISLQDALIATHQRWQLRNFMSEYLDYIQDVPLGRAGRLHVSEGEPDSPIIVRRRLDGVAKAFNIPLTIKRTGQDIFYWREEETAPAR